jgi:hypothetical protein
MGLIFFMVSDQERLLPHFGQNLTLGGNGAPQRVHTSEEATRCPQFPQKTVPGARGALQWGQVAPPGVPPSCAPQLTQRRAWGLLSVPHCGHGLYLLPQLGQKLDVEGYFLPQLEQ